MAGKTKNNEQNFEQTLWQAADKLRKNIDAAEYKHIVLGLIFLKYISDAFEEKRGQLEFEFSNPEGEWYIKETQERKDRPYEDVKGFVNLPHAGRHPQTQLRPHTGALCGHPG